jgi:hypothetical protein
MKKQLYIIDYENAHWCGGQSNVVVWAESKDDAVCKASNFMEENMRDLFMDHYMEEGNSHDDESSYDDESAVSINSVEDFGPGHDEWKFFMDPSQSSFYPVIGSES